MWCPYVVSMKSQRFVADPRLSARSDGVEPADHADPLADLSRNDSIAPANHYPWRYSLGFGVEPTVRGGLTIADGPIVGHGSPGLSLP